MTFLATNAPTYSTSTAASQNVMNNTVHHAIAPITNHITQE